jgi:WS/DGAT/MGAT family acyltransferase
VQQLSGLDASFLYLETPTAPMHVGGLQIYDQSTAPGGLVTFKQILGYVERRLHLARTLRERLARVPGDLDHPYWYDDPDFDIEFHVRHLALPKPGDWRQLCIQVARLMSRHVDLSRPLWEMYVIEGLDAVEGLPEGCFALVTKVHHAAVDGVSGMELTAILNQLDPDAEPEPPSEPYFGESPPASGDLLRRAMMHNLTRPMHFGRVVGRTVPAAGRVVQGLRGNRLDSSALNQAAPRTRFNRPVGPHRVFDAIRFPLADVKKARQAVPGSTVNDVVLSVVGGALRSYLQGLGELPEQTLIAMAPISVRSESQKGTAGNQVSAMFVPLRTDVEDPVERLAQVYAGTQNAKEMVNAIGARLMTDYGQFIPSALAGLAARLYTRAALADRHRPVVNTVVTNVPGPQVPLYFCGAKQVAYYGLGPVVDGMGLIHPVLSYDGMISICATADRGMMPDPAHYADCLRRSVDDLLVTVAKT